MTTLKTQNKHYVYGHFRVSNSLPFYIGKGSKNRAYSTNKRNKYHTNIIKSTDYRIEILEYFDTPQNALNREKYLISYFKSIGACEANFHPGGSGGDTFSLLPEEDKNKFRNKMRDIVNLRPIKCINPVKGRSHPNYGKSLNKGFKHSEEFRQKCKSNMIGSKNPMFGKVGAKHPKFKGYYVTPAGIFESAKEANIANNTKYSKYYCKISKHRKDWYFLPIEEIK